ncbi:VRR-NUC domain-containing protein [Vibrio sp. LaRot3]|uniref:VRR-NUC domain-containing protein n=1 Tax=Vibrio sp. LaRot3 TaxID=2998829 RepID=UPI0022CDD74A|nr:VRR-NUC domain-containing protein [Vibrio sp. LaRot3]MDA0148209.1 VRR-NUC domain-containing protein [Vibrio sp. LaRot3]
MKIDLPADYYLDNFCKLIEHAQSQYHDLLREDELGWLEQFGQLSKDAQCLLVRLYSRKGELFRTDKLNYAEIASISAALDELAQQTLISINPKISHQLVAEILLKSEIIALYPTIARSSAKSDAIAQLSNKIFEQHHLLSFRLIRLERSEMLDVLLTLFFANTHQDLSQFVLDDLGLHTFEQYPLSKKTRYFQTREQLDLLITLSHLESQFYQSDRKNIAQLHELAKRLPESIEHPRIERKRGRLINEIARDFERLEQWSIALPLFSQTQLPPSRERRARIFDKLDDLESLRDIVTEMSNSPYDVSELEIANKLEQRLQRKLGHKVPRAKKPTSNTFQLELDLSQNRVELVVQQHLEQQGWRVFYSENALLTGLFGLAFWPMIFAPIEGAFINPFQHRPFDLYHNDFVQQRMDSYQACLRRLQHEDLSYLVDVYDKKYGISNPFVHWSIFSKELLQQAIHTIPRHQLIALFEVLTGDLKLYRSGMPDLIAFKDQRFEWIEVKGPGDKLQDNQYRWIKHFQQLEIPFKLCLVNH